VGYKHVWEERRGGNAPMIQRIRKKGRKRMVRIVIRDSRARPLGWLEGE